MSAEILRRAASLMRERAEAATGGPWFTDAPHGFTDYPECLVYAPGRTEITPGGGEHGDYGLSIPNATHIASWHPAVALAVADLLDRLADDREADPYLPKVFDAAALDVARAYLGAEVTA